MTVYIIARVLVGWSHMGRFTSAYVLGKLFDVCMQLCTWIKFVSVGISYHMSSKVCTYLFPKFYCCIVEVWEWIGKFIPHVTVDPYWDYKQSMLAACIR